MEASQVSGGAQPPAGWYPNSEIPGQQRYWDGQRWTDHVQAQPPPPRGATPAPMTDADARQWATFAHLSALVGLVIGLSFVGPLIVYLVKKDDHPFVADQGREALNFNLSVLIYSVVGVIATFILVFILIGLLLIPVLIAMGIAWLVFVIIAAVKANQGETYRYPLTIRMVS